MLVSDTGLKRYHLTKKQHKKGYRRKGVVCGTCARTKITRKTFSRKESVTFTNFLDKLTCDISVYLNCPSKEGWKYMLVFTDEATKMFWSYGLFERTTDAVLVCLKDLYEKQLCDGEVIKLFHSDGGTRKFSNTPTDTPELNSVSERKFRTLGEMALAMLSRSGMPKVWWGKAYMAAQYVLRRMPTNTAPGYMTPLEAVPGGEAPSWKWLRVWGCKAYVLTPKADRRKDWEDKAQVGYFVGYDETTVGWQIYLPSSDMFVTTVHALFDEEPPERPEDYYKDLDAAAAVFTGPESESVEEYQYLVDTHHIDPEDSLLYVTKRVTVRKGLIVAYRAQVTGQRSQPEEKTSIHVKDVVLMTNMTVGQRKALTLKAQAEADKKLLSRPHSRSKFMREADSEAPDASTEGELRTRRDARSTGSATQTSDSADTRTDTDSAVNGGQTTRSDSAMEVSHDGSTPSSTVSTDGKRVRVQRHPHNIHMLGEVNQVMVPHARHC